MTFAVTILGCGSALPAKGKHHSAHALNVHEQFYLIDCGEGTQSRLMKYGVNPLKLRAIFITHLHGDHFAGLSPLLSTMTLMGRRTPLEVHAPAPFGRILEFHKEFFDPQATYEVIWKEVDTRTASIIYENKVMQVKTVPLRHRVPAAGFIFREKEPPLNVRKEAIQRYSLDLHRIIAAKNGEDLTLDDGTVLANASVAFRPYKPRSYAYCSDTGPSGKVRALVKNVDLLYHEATFSDADQPIARKTGHSTTVDAAKTALEAGAGRLIIGHFSNRYTDLQPLLDQARAVFPATELAKEGETLKLEF